MIRKCAAFIIICMDLHLIFKYQVTFCSQFKIASVFISFLPPSNTGFLGSYRFVDEKGCAEAAWNGATETYSGVPWGSWYLPFQFPDRFINSWSAP